MTGSCSTGVQDGQHSSRPVWGASKIFLLSWQLTRSSRQTGRLRSCPGWRPGPSSDARSPRCIPDGRQTPTRLSPVPGPGSEHLVKLLLTHLDERPLGKLLVHLRLVQDVLGPAGVLQGAQSLLRERRSDR